jgi:hypothetical protein
VRQGAARVYRRYSDDPGLLLLEAERMPLWEWRAADRHLR